MTRDYAKKTSQKNHKRPNARKSRAAKQGAPGWLWLLAGILLGGLIVMLYQLANTEDSDKQPAPQKTKPQQQAQEEPNGKPRFDFYTLLRETEVIVPDNPTPTNRSGGEAVPEPKVTANEVFLLQVGSFKSNSDADSLRARLLLLNLSTSIEMVSPRKGETWHRVLVGPFTNHSDVTEARNRLASNGIDSLLLKRKE